MTLFLVLSACEKQYELPLLTYENIKHLTLGSMSEDQIYELATRQLIKSDKTSYQNIKNDKDQLSDQLSLIVESLQNTKNQSSRQYIFKSKVFDRQFNPKDQTVNFMFPFEGGMLIKRMERYDHVFPEFIHILIANSEAYSKVTASQLKGFEYKSDLNDMNVVYTIEIVKAQNVDYLQAIIRAIDVYHGSDYSNLIFNQVEQRNALEIVENRLLSGGYSLKLGPIHSFGFLGHRILDPFYDLGQNNKACLQNGLVHGHQLIECRYQYLNLDSGSIHIETQVVGGRVTDIKLIATGAIPEQTQQRVVSKIRSDLNLKNRFLAGDLKGIKKDLRFKKVRKVKPDNYLGESEFILSWEYFGTQISYDSKALKVTSDDARTVFEIKAMSWEDYQNQKKGA